MNDVVTLVIQHHVKRALDRRNPVQAHIYQPKPLRARPYKQFLVTLSAIYPLTQLIPWLLSPLLRSDPLQRWPAASGLIVVVVIVYLMIYVIMPRYSRLVAK